MDYVQITGLSLRNMSQILENPTAGLPALTAALRTFPKSSRTLLSGCNEINILSTAQLSRLETSCSSCNSISKMAIAYGITVHELHLSVLIETSKQQSRTFEMAFKLAFSAQWNILYSCMIKESFGHWDKSIFKTVVWPAEFAEVINCKCDMRHGSR